MATRKKKATKEVSMKANKEGLLYAAIADIEIEEGFNVRKNSKADDELIAHARG